MRSLRTARETNPPVASMTVRHRTRLLLTAVAAVGVVAIALAVRTAVQRVPSQDTARLAAIGVIPVTAPKTVPAFDFTDDAQHSLSLADFRGRAVVLNVWATWCVPCRQEMPSLDRLEAKLGGPHFHVVAISIDKQGAPVVQSFYRDLGLRSLGIYLDPSGNAASALGSEGVPATLLINADGNEIGRKLGALEWDRPAVIDSLRKAFALTEVTR